MPLKTSNFAQNHSIIWKYFCSLAVLYIFGHGYHIFPLLVVCIWVCFIFGIFPVINSHAVLVKSKLAMQSKKNLWYLKAILGDSFYWIWYCLCLCCIGFLGLLCSCWGIYRESLLGFYSNLNLKLLTFTYIQLYDPNLYYNI